MGGRNGATRTFGESLERALARLAGGVADLARDAVVTALLVPAAGGLAGCTEARVPPAAPPPDKTVSALSDWLHDQGTRNTGMVSYMGAFWTQNTDCGPRGGCQGVDVFLKVRVLRVEGADLNSKRVGVLCGSPFCTASGTTAVGSYAGDLGDGWEEWHVPLNRRTWETGAFTFAAWYQDGKGNTFYDDNDGELHAAAYRGTPVVLRHDWVNTAVTVGADGVKGRISMILASLDFDKDVRMVWTTDRWKTVNELGLAADAALPNGWRWKEDAGNGFERWEIQLDLPGAADRFEYAVMYRHGVVSPARTYDFWDNNGGLNHVVVKGAYSLPFAPAP